MAHSDEEIAGMLRSMSDAGVVLHFQDRVYLQPKEIAETIISVRVYVFVFVYSLCLYIVFLC